MARKHLKSLLRWGVAVAGTWYVLSQLYWNDHALVVISQDNIPVWAGVLSGDEHSTQLTVQIRTTGKVLTINHDALVEQPDKSGMTVTLDGKQRLLLGLDIDDQSNPRRLLVLEDGHGTWVPADKTNYTSTIPYPLVQIGVRHLLASAQHLYLLLSILVFPLTFIITAFRWQELLKALDIRLPIERTFVLNMVGAFYNTFMPGSTGGDVLKAYYVALQTHHRTRAVMSVVVDRVIGLLALIILGGAMAGYAAWRWRIHQTAGVALFSLGIVLCTAGGLTVFFNPTLRRMTGLDWILRRLPMQRRVHKAVEAMHLYGRRPGLAAAALLASFPVHAVVILSAFFAGTAFGLHIPWYYYWTVVPVAVLAGAIPISPQGAGVMEYFAILLLTPIHCSAAEAVVLTMSIRLVQVLWNLAGGAFVLRGGYHAPTIAQEEQVEQEDEDRILNS